MADETLHRAYLSLGSNTGDRRAHLETALKALEPHARVLARSSVYRTQPWGFDGAEFYNMVVLVETDLEPEALLAHIKSLEAGAGRTPETGKSGVYADRPLDIDILTYDHQVIEREDLQIPHPHLARRRFVLVPWAELAPDFRVPGWGKSVAELLAETDDRNGVERLDDDFGEFPFSFLTIEGNIGAGKTTLARMMSRDFNGKLILERFEENPFLPKFYDEPERYAFPLEMSFLADRYQQLTDELSKPELFSNGLISDYFIIKSLIFAGVTLTDDEYALYRKIFNFMYRDLRKPDLYVYLYRTPENLLENIAKRGREYEKNITARYLSDVHKAYMQFMQEQTDMPVLILDITGVDFVRNPEKYREIVQNILRFPQTGKPMAQQKILP